MKSKIKYTLLIFTFLLFTGFKYPTGIQMPNPGIPFQNQEQLTCVNSNMIAAQKVGYLILRQDAMGLKIQAATKLLPKDHPIRQLIEAGLSMVALTIVIQSYKRKNKEIPNLVYKEAKRTFIKLSWLAWNRCKNQPTSKKVIKV